MAATTGVAVRARARAATAGHPACHRRLEDDAPGDAERGAEEVGAGG